MPLSHYRLLAIALLMALPGPASAESERDPSADRHARVRLVPEVAAFTPGETAWIGIRVDLEEHWHTYWHGRNDTGYPVTVELALPPGFTAGEMLWPAPERLVSPGDIVDHVYEHGVTLLLPLHVPEGLEPGRRLEVGMKVDYLVCKSACVPESDSLVLSLPVGVATAAPAAPTLTGAAAAAGATADQRLLDDARALLPRPWSEAGDRVTASWQDTTLVVSAPGAAGLAFFPAESSGRLVNLVTDGEARGTRLSLRFSPEEGVPLRADGVLEVRDHDDRRSWFALNLAKETSQ